MFGLSGSDSQSAIIVNQRNEYALFSNKEAIKQMVNKLKDNNIDHNVIYKDDLAKRIPKLLKAKYALIRVVGLYEHGCVREFITFNNKSDLAQYITHNKYADEYGEASIHSLIQLGSKPKVYEKDDYSVKSANNIIFTH